MIRNKTTVTISVMILLVVGTISIAGCTNDKESNSSSQTAASTSKGSIMTDQENTDQKIDALEKENDELDMKVAELETQLKDQETARILLNKSFKIISAMDRKDYDYLKSVSGPDVKISESNNQIITEKYGEYNLLTAPMDKLEYRGGGHPEGWDEDHFQISLASVSTEKGKEGAAEIYIDFVKINDEWKYDGHVTN